MHQLQILIDADACPRELRGLLTKAAERTQVPITFVSNHPIGIRAGGLVNAVIVESGFDRADQWIVQAAHARCVVVTADIPLAAEVVEKGAKALDFRGNEHRAETIKQKLGMRDFFDTMRSGITKGEAQLGRGRSGGAQAFSPRDKQNFSNTLNRLIDDIR